MAPAALAIYGLLALVTLGLAFVSGQNPLEVEPWVGPGGLPGHAVSVAVGAMLAAVTVRASRAFVKRWGWAKSLHAHLRPAIRGSGDLTLVVLGLASGIAEELFFRGLLAPVLGVILSSLAFGALHRLQGKVGWIWASWATVMGLLFGALYLGTGSLLGPIVAHAAINVTNLRFLRDTDVEPRKPRRLGGLLGRA